MKIGVFTTPMGPQIVEQAVKSCEELGVECRVVDIFSADWLENIKMASDCDGFFCPSNCISQELKTIQDERYFFVSEILHRPIYPDFTGLYIHESKRNMAAWLELNDYPHAKTKVFTRRKEALDYLESCKYPIVTKANVGSGASKVVIVNKKRIAKRMVKKCLTESFSFMKPGWAYKMRFKHWYVPPIWDIRNRQKDYLIVQDYVKDVIHEWRIIKIGDSYFGHQKLLKDNFASGSGMVGWVAPPDELLKMVHQICEKGGFYCMDVDIFETKEGLYCINELQASFGSYLDYQMCIDGRHGRFVYKEGDFVFEEGNFNVYGSTKLKIEHFINLLSK